MKTNFDHLKMKEYFETLPDNPDRSFIEEAIAMAKDAIEGCLKVLKEEGVYVD